MYGSKNSGSRFISFCIGTKGKHAATKNAAADSNLLRLILVAVKNSYIAIKASAMMAALSTGVWKKLSTITNNIIPTIAEITRVFNKISPFLRLLLPADSLCRMCLAKQIETYIPPKRL